MDNFDFGRSLNDTGGVTAQLVINKVNATKVKARTIILFFHFGFLR